MLNPHTSDIRMINEYTSDMQMTYEYIRVTYGWHTSIRVTYGWHTSRYKWHTDDIRVDTSDIRMTYKYIWVTYGWHTSTYELYLNDIRVTYGWHALRKKNKVIFLKHFDNSLLIILFNKIKKGSGINFYCTFSAWFFHTNVLYFNALSIDKVSTSYLFYRILNKICY